MNDDLSAELRFAPRDSVDRQIAGWHAALPPLDVTPLHVIARLARVRGHLDGELGELFARHGLSAADFAVLVTLMRLRRPGGLSQRSLMTELGLTSGTVSVRIDRLVAAGLVDRRPDPDLRRNVLVTLTAAGERAFARAAPAHVANEARLLAALEPAERALLGDLLRKLLVEYEGSRPVTGRRPALGLVLAPAHVTIAMRQAVGLTASPGLLVRAVRDGPASRAGVRAGDVLMRAAGHDVSSITTLYRALAEPDEEASVTLELVRGRRRRRVAVALQDPPAVAATAAETAGRLRHDEHLI